MLRALCVVCSVSRMWFGIHRIVRYTLLHPTSGTKMGSLDRRVTPSESPHFLLVPPSYPSLKCNRLHVFIILFFIAPSYPSLECNMLHIFTTQLYHNSLLHPQISHVTRFYLTTSSYFFTTLRIVFECVLCVCVCVCVYFCFY
jgi:hypothetical protein